MHYLEFFLNQLRQIIQQRKIAKQKLESFLPIAKYDSNPNELPNDSPNKATNEDRIKLIKENIDQKTQKQILINKLKQKEMIEQEIKYKQYFLEVQDLE